MQRITHLRTHSTTHKKKNGDGGRQTESLFPLFSSSSSWFCGRTQKANLLKSSEQAWLLHVSVCHVTFSLIPQIISYAPHPSISFLATTHSFPIALMSTYYLLLSPFPIFFTILLPSVCQLVLIYKTAVPLPQAKLTIRSATFSIHLSSSSKSSAQP